jgi:hypothetical protein
MPIDRKIEAATRKMLRHAIRHELEELAALIYAEGNKTLEGMINLCVYAAGYIAIDVVEAWPSDAALHRIAEHAAKSVTRLDISEEEIYEFLVRVALGDEMVDDLFTIEGVGTVPLYATANLLLTFCPKDKHWSEYLDQIWNAANASERVRWEVMPALMIRARKQGTGRPGNTPPGS